MKRTLLLTVLLTSLQLTANSAELKVASPDGRTVATVSHDGDVLLSLTHNGAVLLKPSTIGINIEGLGAPKIGKPTTLTNVREHITAPFYRQAEFDYVYNELTLPLGKMLSLTVRVSNEGVAYRYSSTVKGEIVVPTEMANFQLPGDNTVHLAYTTNDKDPWAMAFQNRYTSAPIDSLPEELGFLPACVDYEGGMRLTILESDLRDYPGLWLRPDNGTRQLRAIFAPYPATMAEHPWRAMTYVDNRQQYIAKTNGERTFPWRILAVSDSDTEMPTNNLVYALAEPNKIGDASWIEPGKVAWDWWNDWGLKHVNFKAGINMATYKYYIDFAARHGLQYVVLDEGWYDSNSGDIMTAIPELELPDLVAYAREAGVRIILWAVFNVLDEQLEKACERYSRMGIAGFKVDFLDRDDQTAVAMTWRIAEACARHHLVLDYHGIYKPVGLNRTYPNVLNIEAVFGMEEVKWSAPGTDMPLYDVTFPYLRGQAGPVDYTPGAMRNASKDDWKPVYRNPVSMGTRAHQVAAYIVHDTPLTMLADAPTAYEAEPECTGFIASLPTVFDETRVVSGILGEHIVVARRKGATWYVAGQTNWQPRDLDIKLDFLPAGKAVTASLFTDGLNADEQADDYSLVAKNLKGGDTLKVHLAQGGGFVAVFKED